MAEVIVTIVRTTAVQRPGMSAGTESFSGDADTDDVFRECVPDAGRGRRKGSAVDSGEFDRRRHDQSE